MSAIDGTEAEVPCASCGDMFVGPHILCPNCWDEVDAPPADDRNSYEDDDE